jgi:L-asparaginase II
MQTHEQVHTKVHEMMQSLQSQVHDEVERLLVSGALDLEEASDDFRIPKLVYAATLRYLSTQYEPMAYDKSGQKTYKNLLRF